MSKKIKKPRITGILEKTRSGNAFVRTQSGSDIFIYSDNIGSAMDGDTVSVDLLPKHFWGKNPEGIVDKIMERSKLPIVGTYVLNGKFAYIELACSKKNERVYIKRSNSLNAKSGDKVKAEVIAYPNGPRELPEGRITEIIAKKGARGAELKAMIIAKGVSLSFPSEVEIEASEKASSVITDSEIALRRDLRDKAIITIDGKDSKDLDDAISLNILQNGNYLLGVHIADVSYYVKQDSFLDKEAFYRGTSIYLYERVIPMLPKSLSNGICSLFEGADRLTLSCEMEIDSKGNLVSHKIENSIINSKARMVYDDVSDIIENYDPELCEKYSNYNGCDITSLLYQMAELAEILCKKRSSAGSIDFNVEESCISVDKEGFPIDVRPELRRTANRMIEEFMLMANQTVAEHFEKKNLPFVYRVHEKPDTDKFSDVHHFLMNLDQALPQISDVDVKPKDVCTLLNIFEETRYEEVVNTILLRSMSKAYYDVDCKGHFGLAFKYYCHFTSPIRRYPDLMIHRLIKFYLSDSNISEKQKSSLLRKADMAANQSSIAERHALELERDVEKYKKAQYISKHIGETFEGIISGVTDYGIFVKLSNTIEGMIRLETISDDYYEYDSSKYRIIGRRKHKVYALGDPVTVNIESSNPDNLQIDFSLLKS